MTNLDMLVGRLLAIKHGASYPYGQHTPSCVMLMREYLRRLATSGHALASPRVHPFLDLAQLINSKIRADESLVEQVTAHMRRQCGAHAALLAKNALHFAALTDTEKSPKGVPSDVYEPVIILLERGGSITHEGAGFIDIDSVGVPIQDLSSFLRDKPFTSLEATDLDRLDERQSTQK